MRKILSLLLLSLALPVLADGPVIQSTPFSRQLLRAADPGTARSALGITSTNANGITNQLLVTPTIQSANFTGNGTVSGVFSGGTYGNYLFQSGTLSGTQTGGTYTNATYYGAFHGTADGSTNAIYSVGSTYSKRYAISNWVSCDAVDILASISIGSSTMTATWFDTNIAPYGIQLVSAGNGFTANDVGKYVSIWQAGTNVVVATNALVPAVNLQDLYVTNKLNLVATIVSVLNSSQVSLSLPASNTVTGARAVYGSDQTAKFQAARDFATTNRNITLLYPDGGFVIAGPILDPGVNTAHHNSQITTLPVPGNYIGNYSIINEGVSPGWMGGVSSLGSAQLPYSYGSTIWDFYVRGPNATQSRMIDTRSFSSPIGQLENPLNEEWRNITVRGCYDNNIGLLDFYGSQNCEVEDCRVDSGYDEGTANGFTTGAILTGTNGYGVLLPSQLNENHVIVKGGSVNGFYNALSVNGNALIFGTHFSGNWNCIDLGTQDHAPDIAGVPNFGYFLWFQQNKNLLSGGQTQEHFNLFGGFVGDGYIGQNVWWKNPNYVNDPGNSIVGKLNFHNSFNTTNWSVIGGKYVKITSTTSGLGSPQLGEAEIDAGTFVSVNSYGKYGRDASWHVGSDYNNATITAGVYKDFSISFPRYEDSKEDLSANSFPIQWLDIDSGASNSTSLNLGGNDNSDPAVNSITFSTSPDDVTTSQPRWGVDSSGNFVPRANAGTMGTSGNPLSGVYASNLSWYRAGIAKISGNRNNTNVLFSTPLASTNYSLVFSPAYSPFINASPGIVVVNLTAAGFTLTNNAGNFDNPSAFTWQAVLNQ